MELEQAPSGHTFETFVVGDSNRDAHRLARDIVDSDIAASLLVYGPTGVGKTHLLHAMAHGFRARGVAVACLPAAEFVDQLLGAWQRREEETFWRALDGLGALLLDD